MPEEIDIDTDRLRETIAEPPSGALLRNIALTLARQRHRYRIEHVRHEDHAETKGRAKDDRARQTLTRPHEKARDDR